MGTSSGHGGSDGRVTREVPARLLIADDHALLRAGMRAMLDLEPGLEVAGEAADGREAEVQRLLAAGKTNRSIAAEMHLTLFRPKRHVERIIAKLGVSDRTQAAVRAAERGLLAPPAGG